MASSPEYEGTTRLGFEFCFEHDDDDLTVTFAKPDASLASELGTGGQWRTGPKSARPKDLSAPRSRLTRSFMLATAESPITSHSSRERRSERSSGKAGNVEVVEQKPSFLIGSLEKPLAFIDGGFVITPRGIEQAPKVIITISTNCTIITTIIILVYRTVIKNVGSGIDWSSFDFYDIHEVPEHEDRIMQENQFKTYHHHEAQEKRKKQGDERLMNAAELVKSALITVEETQFLQRVFNFVDKDGDGTLQRDEVIEMLLYLGERKENVQAGNEDLELLFDKLNLSRDGGLSFETFIDWWAKESKEVSFLRDAFNKYDADGSGYIDLEELHELLKDLGHNYTLNELRRMMKLMVEEESLGLDFERFTSLTLRLSYWNKVGVKGSTDLHF
ncbi:hypothetical protein GUITHDRAFT_103354 [Guillardia theta CCMP2712]|uniref:EF-hand domain-containing protein n=1 Tax=Guillardia theta (strain CCMP2712) TaxID=905079 RepID=L1JQQ1_GUITC|nr:hypothetical protein GUITHDRAFT_103354 [Guillardia theta CCMP2712]EKX50762.1 hypothetical protein GUITHDRAFT_103354 [Guillardia theta CCMP2712]|eukprot:XP_005837742.1 hypothetical protein GUITHDRAFT_103354 [Guillardia theta CCMP2712]